MRTLTSPRAYVAFLRPFSVLALLGAAACGSLQLPGEISNGGSSVNPNIASNGNVISNGNITNPVSTASSRATCKRGMASGTGVSPKLSANDMAVLAPGVSWWYNWGLRPDNANAAAAAANLNVSFVPMVWGGPTVNANAVIAQIPANSKYILGFNEPNFTSQGNLTPQQAAALWPQIEKIAQAQNLKIVAPAVNYCGGGCNVANPNDWLNQFFAACTNCKIDAIAIHAYVCYDSALVSAYLKPFKAFGKPIWLTEFACSANNGADSTTVAAQKTFMQAAVADMEADPQIERYAWFLARNDDPSWPVGLLGADGQLNELGQTYVSLPQACDPN